jgi:HEAT repeats
MCSPPRGPLGETAAVVIGVGDLIGDLDYPDGRGEDAKFELISRGADVVPYLAARVAGLERLGKLLAVEVFEALGDPRACPSLIALLRDDDPTVAEWSASALGSLGRPEAVVPLLDLRSRLVADRVPPGWTGPVAVRRALDDLGVRQAVVPAVTAGLKLQRAEPGMQLFRSADLATVIDDLAGFNQVVLYFQVWRIGSDGHLYWVQGDREEWVFDWPARWSENVAAAHAAALADAARLVPQPDLLVQLEWIDEDDISANR